jgi:hypothetical protein
MENDIRNVQKEEETKENREKEIKRENGLVKRETAINRRRENNRQIRRNVMAVAK